LTATKLDRPLKRELEIAGAPYILTITPDGMELVLKAKRKGFELNWAALVSGDAAIAATLERLAYRQPDREQVAAGHVGDQEARRGTARVTERPTAKAPVGVEAFFARKTNDATRGY
jgi:hypothetical protein